jgi:broad specificity phosphatase PhoE
MSIESTSHDSEKLYPDHYEFGKPEPVSEVSEQIERAENFVPVTITVIRHNLTSYKELQDPNFQFDPSVKELDSETLDITEQGIAGMRATAEDLASRIDTDKEVIYVVTSPQYRAQSSLLVLIDELRKRGIEVVNDPAQPDTEHTILPNLRQNSFKDPKDQDTGTEAWLKAANTWWSEDPEGNKKMMLPHLAHAEVAKILGHNLSEILDESHTEAFERFMRTMRHIANTGNYLTSETRAALKGKKLRVIVLTHEELPSAFLQHAFDAKQNLKNGQVLEIEAEGFMQDGKEVSLDARLYPLRSTESFSPTIPSEFPDVQARRVPVTFTSKT